VRKASHHGSKQQQSSHAVITLLLLVRATYMHDVVLHAHPVRGESHNQPKTTGEAATLLKSALLNTSSLFQLYSKSF